MTLTTGAVSPPTPKGWIARRIALGTLANLATPALALLTGPLIARLLGPTGRGELSAIVTPISFVGAVGLLGVPLAAVYVAASTSATRRQILRAALPIVVCMSALAVVALTLVAPVLLDGRSHDVRNFRLVVLTLPAAFIVDVMGGIVLGERRYGLTYFASVVSAVSRAVALVGLAVAGVLTVVTTVWASTISGLISLLVFGRLFLQRDARSALDQRDVTKLTRTLASYGLRSWGEGVAGIANRRLDQVLLFPLAGAAQLGYYAVAVSFAELTTPMTGAINRILFPEVAARPGWAGVARAARCTTLAIGVLCMLGVAIVPLVIPRAFGGEFTHAVPMAQVLLVASVPLALRSVLASGLLAAGRPGASSASQIVALAITAPGLALLVPWLGAIGAAWTSLMAYSAACAFCAWQIRSTTRTSLRIFLVPRFSDVVWMLGQLRLCISSAKGN